MPYTPPLGTGIRARVRRVLHSIRRDDASRDREIDDELQAHLDARAAYLIARGVPPDAARAEALRRFGDIESGRAYLRAFARHERRRTHLQERLHEVTLDLRYVLRGLRNSPAFTLGVVVTFALGLGINAAVFRIADVVLLRAPAGVAEPRALRHVETSMSFGGAPIAATSFSGGDAESVMQSAAFASASSYASRSARSADGRDVAVTYVGRDFFSVLGVTPAVGRMFDSTESAYGAGVAVIVLSYDYWQRALGGGPIDRLPPVTLNDRPYTVVGVAPPGFTGLALDPTTLWLPLGVATLGRATINGTEIPWYSTEMSRQLRLVGRLREGIAPSVTSERLAAAIAPIDVTNGRPKRSVILRPIVPMGEGTSGGTADGARLLGPLFGVALVILLIACANGTNLLLARGLRRRQEITIRMAMGASRARVIRLLVIESVVLALIGGLTAAVFGYWTGDALRRLIFPDAHWGTAMLDPRVLGFTIGLTVVIGLAAGVVPALQLSTPDLAQSLKDSRSRGGARTRLTRGALVVLQGAFSVMLLVASGLLMRSLEKLNAIPLGYVPDGLVTADLGNAMFGGSSGRGAMSPADLAARMRRDPAVRDVAVATMPPFGSVSMMTMSIPGNTTPGPAEDQTASWMGVSTNFFSVMQTRILQGRAFTTDDRAGSEPVAIISASMAHYYWPGSIPFGSCVLTQGWPCARIVGVAEDMRDAHTGSAPRMRYYLPFEQIPPDRFHGLTTVIARSGTAGAPGDALGVATGLRRALPATQHPVIEVVATRAARAMRPWRLATLLFIALGALALALVCVGVYSVMSFIASERVHELGVRMVLGATAPDVVRLMVHDGLRLIVSGGALGLVGAAAGARLLSALLFGVSRFDPVVYAAGLVCLVVVGTAAMLSPAFRASRVDPVSALRSE